VFGRAFTQRLVTQMYSPGDPLFAQDPIYNWSPTRAPARP
jgi:protocatechuate 3,4-dioxygenase beta subunit